MKFNLFKRKNNKKKSTDVGNKKERNIKQQNNESVDLERYFIIASGKVQGVGFRFFTNYTAVNCNLTGWVRNWYDGTVHMEVQGLGIDIYNFMKKIKKGDGFIKVEDICIKKIQAVKEEKNFKIKY